MDLTAKQMKMQEFCKNAKISHLFANGASQRSTQLNTNRVITEDAIGECDRQLEQQTKDVMEFTKSFVSQPIEYRLSI